MDLSEKKILTILKDLKENYHITGIKAEFGEEGTGFTEARKLKEIVSLSKLDLTIKISGCEAVKDMYEVKKNGVTSIVVPMIESPYAVQKFLNSLKNIFSENDYKKIKKFINIETIYGFKYLDEILNSFEKDISGIIFGRTDMACSLGLKKDEVNCSEILNYAKKIAEKTKLYGKEFIIGGGISEASLFFFENLPVNSVDKFETRKVIFDAQKILNNSNASVGILKALEFELFWLKYRQSIYNGLSKENEKRIKVLEARCKNLF